jgi:hypothetical protein
LKLCKAVRDIESSMGSGEDRVVYESELEKRATLVGDMPRKADAA